MKKYIIIPNCSDLNRGDQALVWETQRIAEEAGYIGKYYVTVEDNEPIEQSRQHGLTPISMLLKHPSRFFKYNDNITYNFTLKMKWGIIAVFDLMFSFLLLQPWILNLFYPFFNREKKLSIDTFKEADAIFIKGGGFVHYYGGLTSFYYAYFSLYHIFFAARHKKEIYFMPNSMGPYDGPFIKWIVKKALKKCNLVAVRETLSQKMAKEELGMTFPFYPDLALYLPNSSLKKEDILKKYNIPQGKKIVAITMRPHRFPKSKTPKEDYLYFKQEIAKFIEWLYSQNYLPMLVDHTLAINTNENDAICIHEVTQMLNSNHFFYFSDKNLNCQELKSIYSICDYIVGTRFHSVIFSFSNLVPGLAITYTGNKAQGIMHDFGLDEYAINIETVTCNTLKQKFIKVTQEEDAIKNKIKDYLQYAQKARVEMINHLKKK